MTEIAIISRGWWKTVIGGSEKFMYRVGEELHRRGYKVVEEGLNYVYGFGGRVFNEKLEPVINSQEAVDALFLYGLVVWKAAPPGAINWEFDEAFQAAQAGKAAMMITYNWMIAALNDPEQSLTAGKWSVAPVPGGFAVLGAWGWAIPYNAPNKEAAFKFLKWVALPETEKKLALIGHAPVRRSTFMDPDVNNKFPYMKILEKVVANSLPIVPPVLPGEQIVQILGERFSNSLTYVKDFVDGKASESDVKARIKAELDQAAQEIRDVMEAAGYYEEPISLPPPWGPG
jgi:ABC-type glycerol-3-phosphate transport system substrate-binding protein